MNSPAANVQVFCGSDVIGSRRSFVDQLEQFTAQGNEIVHAEGKNIDANFFEINLNSTTLFGQKRVIAIENFLSLPKSELKDQHLKLLGKIAGGMILLWEGKEITKTNQKEYPANFIFTDYKLPNEVFNLLDQLQPANIKATLALMEKLRDIVDENYLFLMLARQIRLLILVKGGKTTIVPPWQLGKLKHQADSFTDDQLHDTYRNLRNIDYRQKTSQTVGSYYSDIQFLLANLSSSC